MVSWHHAGNDAPMAPRMTPALLLGFAGFVFVVSVTPGPNNAMLLASGANHGFRRSVPQLLGIAFGCVAMLVAVALGVGEAFRAAPALHDALRVAGGAYLLWLAWCIARSGEAEPGDGRAPGARRPITFLQSALFQWVNPKAWIMTIGAVAAYAPREASAADIAALAVVMAVVGLPSAAIWSGFGVAIRPLLGEPGRLRAFNLAMAGLLVLSLASLLA
jgi:threonine/homoserine/homoserine lactone efflux protein